MATITYGCVIVPILHEFNPESMEEIIAHSDSRLVFVNDTLWNNLSRSRIEVPVFEIPSFSLLTTEFADIRKVVESLDHTFTTHYPKGFTREDIRYPDVSNDEVICINYTSGTTGFSKGVMITANNCRQCHLRAQTGSALCQGEDTGISAHGPRLRMRFRFSLCPLCGGAQHAAGGNTHAAESDQCATGGKTKLNHHGTPDFRKDLQKKILPIINKPIVKAVMHIPGMDRLILSKIRKSLFHSLGGNFREVIIGGAALNGEVEAFFHKMKFPFTVGYGMTECAPLISYDHHYDFVPGSCGSVLEGIMEARIESPDPEKIPGEIQVRGEM